MDSFEFFRNRDRNSGIPSGIIPAFFLVLILIGCATSKKSNNSTIDKGLVQTNLFANGADGIANYRIPALITTTKGTLLTACDARVDRRGDKVLMSFK